MEGKVTAEEAVAALKVISDYCICRSCGNCVFASKTTFGGDSHCLIRSKNPSVIEFKEKTVLEVVK